MEGWVCWNVSKVDVTVVNDHEQANFCRVLDLQSGKGCLLYAKNTLEERRELWRFITESCAVMDEPMMIGGDFNNVLCEGDRDQGQVVTDHETREFAECLQENDLVEVRVVGSRFTWCNNQSGEQRIQSKIDRVLANVKCMQEFHHIVVERMERGVSDHTPQVVDFGQKRMNRFTPFRFLNVMFEYERFAEIVMDEWNRRRRENLLLDIWFKCKAMKPRFQELNNTVFKNTKERVVQYREKLKEVQQKLLVDGRNEEYMEDIKKQL